MKNLEVFAYDASVSEKHFLKQFLKSLLKIDRPKVALRKIKLLLSYRQFFLASSNHHIQKFVGLDADEEIHCTLKQVLDDITYQNIFLKIDVEGSEYRFLDTLVEQQNRISGLVIEFHDCDVNLKSITSFINKFNLNLVHIHANNYSPIRASDGLPLVLELSFSKHCKAFGEASLPHKLDMPNLIGKEEIHLIINS